jgi:glycosyltransferase involved in cell wall biosynthesis
MDELTPPPSTSGNRSAETPDWSVVVIARNEEAVIARCLESVVQACVGRSYELIFVDSASTDRTVEIAQHYSAHIVRLKATDPMRPSVGRHVGLHFARADRVLFLDGDSVLHAAWIGPAAEALESDPDLAGVAGDMEHELAEESGEISSYKQHYPDSDYTAADHLDGSAAYRREAMQRTGGYNPFLYASEEAELGARLRKAGYCMRRLRVTMTTHFPKNRGETVRELLRRRERGFLFGMGQFARYAYAFKLPVRRPFATIHRHLQFFGMLLLCMLALIIGLAGGGWQPLLAWVVAMITIFVLFVLRAREIRKPVYYFIEWTLGSWFVVRGLLARPGLPEEFPDLLGEAHANHVK